MTAEQLTEPVVEIDGAALPELLALRRRQGDHPVRLLMIDAARWRVEFLPGYWLDNPEQGLLPLS